MLAEMEGEREREERESIVTNRLTVLGQRLNIHAQTHKCHRGVRLLINSNRALHQGCGFKASFLESSTEGKFNYDCIIQFFFFKFVHPLVAII